MTIAIKRGILSPTEVFWGASPDIELSSNAVISELRDKFLESKPAAPLRVLFQGHGMIESTAGAPRRIQGRLLPRWPSLLEAYSDRYWKRLPDDFVRIYYNHPSSCPGFTILAYACSGRRTSLATLRAGLTILELIAILNGNRAIVCQSTNPRIGNRVLRHFGYVPHVPHLKGRHFINRLD